MMRTVFLDCGPLVEPTAGTIDKIARLHLAARRCGCELELQNASQCLVDLISFAGLAEVLGVEVGRKSKKRKHPVGVEEEGELGDPPV
jgi:hypothetical protein